MKLIVYGTLMTGEANHHILTNTDATYMGDVVVPNAVLHNLGSYPGLQFLRAGQSHHVVYGELWDVPEDMIGYLDAFEGVPHMYDRRLCDAYGIGDRWCADIYEYQRDIGEGEYHIKSGNWKDR